jgi:hypothetical protein
MIIKEINLSSPKWFKSWEEKSIQLESSLIEGQLSILSIDKIIIQPLNTHK